MGMFMSYEGLSKEKKFDMHNFKLWRQSFARWIDVKHKIQGTDPNVMFMGSIRIIDRKTGRKKRWVNPVTVIRDEFRAKFETSRTQFPILKAFVKTLHYIWVRHDFETCFRDEYDKGVLYTILDSYEKCVVYHVKKEQIMRRTIMLMRGLHSVFPPELVLYIAKWLPKELKELEKKKPQRLVQA